MNFKVAIVGSRNFHHPMLIDEIIFTVFHKFQIEGNCLTFISGGASKLDKDGHEISVDKYAEDYIDSLNETYKNIYKQTILKKIFYPDWDKYGKSAGFRRNKLIIDEADKILAFWDGKSKGTKHSIDLAIEAGKPIDIYVRT